jgi:hypothetical protein
MSLVNRTGLPRPRKVLRLTQYGERFSAPSRRLCGPLAAAVIDSLFYVCAGSIGGHGPFGLSVYQRAAAYQFATPFALIAWPVESVEHISDDDLERCAMRTLPDAEIGPMEGHLLL